MKLVDTRSNSKRKAGIGDILITDKGLFLVISSAEEFTSGIVLQCEAKLLNLNTYEATIVINKLDDIKKGYKFKTCDEEFTVKDIVDNEKVELVIK